MPKRKNQSTKPTSFPSFLKLPLELQDEIWKLALESGISAAHIVQFAGSHDKTQTDFFMRRMIATGFRSRRAKHISLPRQALMQTCQRSRLIIGSAIKRWECGNHISSPVSWRNPSREYSSFHSQGDRHSWGTLQVETAQQTIYTSHDLVIIPDPKRIINTPRPFHTARGQHRIPAKYAAVPYLTGGHDWLQSTAHARRQMDKVFPFFCDLEILYILIHRDIIRKGERFEVLSILPTMKEYLKKYKRTREETSPNIFLYRNRVYREITDVLLMKLSQLKGLTQTVSVIEWIAKAVRAKNGGDKPPLIIRFMTW